MKEIESMRHIDNNPMLMREKEKEIKKLKLEIEEREEEINRKERRVSDL